MKERVIKDIEEKTSKILRRLPMKDLYCFGLKDWKSRKEQDKIQYC